MHHILMHQAHMHNDQGAYMYMHHVYMHNVYMHQGQGLSMHGKYAA